MLTVHRTDIHYSPFWSSYKRQEFFCHVYCAIEIHSHNFFNILLGHDFWSADKTNSSVVHHTPQFYNRKRQLQVCWFWQIATPWLQPVRCWFASLHSDLFWLIAGTGLNGKGNPIRKVFIFEALIWAHLMFNQWYILNLFSNWNQLPIIIRQCNLIKTDVFHCQWISDQCFAILSTNMPDRWNWTAIFCDTEIVWS